MEKKCNESRFSGGNDEHDDGDDGKAGLWKRFTAGVNIRLKKRMQETIKELR